MGKLATVIPDRMDVRLAGDGDKWINLQFHEKDDHVDVVFNRSQIPFLVEQLDKLRLATPAEK